MLVFDIEVPDNSASCKFVIIAALIKPCIVQLAVNALNVYPAASFPTAHRFFFESLD